jgi:hypothetical protein
MKPRQRIHPQRAATGSARARRLFALIAATALLGLGACGGGDDDEAGTPLVPAVPNSARAEAASSPAADQQR